MALPPLSTEQRRAALEKAVVVRRERGAVRGALKRGELSLREVLTDDSKAIRKMPVRALLEALPAIGKSRARKVLTELRIAESRRVRGLGARQRERLLDRFTPHP
ncbi:MULTISPECIES: integration host factor, actinobacterial type [unclassified Streptomyces]|uniref:integration host factor, actinobacterial type n=1 Tax=unclassified Streptomyces TaxID=2593676 RepID=UPI00226E3484|nr:MULTISPECIES: integration host factor, actinobacterial type [unclassified Streptomyces]MCY0924226.1 integration host factor, actinobacterial type [Streptomyces sp. H27-G5]MCY0963227.1 integration host factor, actinobacterial type [Streptomyces sp. H27-H5]